MSMLSKIQTGVVHKAPRIIVYGTHGIGKTSLAAGAPNAVLIPTEDGADEIGVARFPLCTSFEMMMDALADIAFEEHDFQTVILDSLDWAERLVWEYTCRQNKWGSIEQPGFGKGYVEALNAWHEVINLINTIRGRGIAVIMLAHAEVKHFDDPTTDGYDRYQPALHKLASPKLQEAADAVLFMAWKVVTNEAKEGFGRKITKGMGNGARVLYSEERPAALAKNRYAMPYKMELPGTPQDMWQTVAQHIPFYSA